MSPGTIITANGLRYLVWLGTGWSDERAIVRGAWVEMVGATK